MKCCLIAVDMSLCLLSSSDGSVVLVYLADFNTDPVLGQEFLVAGVGDKFGLTKLLKVFVALPKQLVIVGGSIACDLIEDGEVCCVVLGAK